jgi:hypothetical protein
MTHEQHLDLLKWAIAANLDARHKHDKRRERANRGKPIDLKAIDMTAWDLMSTPDDQLYLEAVSRDPIRTALKEQLNDLGKRLYRLLGSTKAMQSVAEEVANWKPRYWGTRIDIIAKNWDGVGAGNDRWVA